MKLAEQKTSRQTLSPTSWRLKFLVITSNFYMQDPLIKKYYNNPNDLLLQLKRKSCDYWVKRGEKTALKNFQEMAHGVPAYKDFLKKHKVNPNSIKSIKDFKKIPVTNKENYLKSYKLKDLCWNGKFDKNKWVIASTSGSTGEPFYFPRTNDHDKQFKLTAELCLIDYFNIDKKTTLFIDCFALGVWIGGMFMYQAIKSLIDTNKYNLSVITPGADKTETIKAVKKIGQLFDQIIIGGYGPLVKDLIDDGIAQNINWKQYNLKFFFAAEGFTEKFRDYIHQKSGANSIYTDFINHYGTADMGTMAHETPLSIMIRRIVDKDDIIYKEIFRDARSLPTLIQYIPELFYFENIDGRLICSSSSGLPLMRYDLKDRGGVYSIDEIKTILKKHKIDIYDELKRNGLQKKIWNLPLVYLYERSDFTVSIYSVNIYPNSILKALQEKKFDNLITGKFHMFVDFDRKQNQFFKINIELRPNILIRDKIKKEVVDSVISWLNKENSEWRDFYSDPKIRKKIIPKIVYWPYQYPQYFKPGGKQKWIKKNT